MVASDDTQIVGLKVLADRTNYYGNRAKNTVSGKPCIPKPEQKKGVQEDNVPRSLRRARSSEDVMPPQKVSRNSLDTDASSRAEQKMLCVDRENIQDEFCCAEYARDIFDHMTANESKYLPIAGYMSTQAEVTPKMRQILVDWLVEVHYKFKLSTSDVLHLAVNLADRYLSKVNVPKSNLQLVGVVCLLIAAKYEEIYPPEIRDFVHITDRAYTREAILDMEIKILNTLNFNVTVPLAIRFMQRYLQVMKVPPKTKRWHLAHFMLELMLPQYDMLRHKPSVLASSAIFLANRLMLFGTKSDARECWPKLISEYTGYSEFVIRPCTKEILTHLVNVAGPNATAKAELNGVVKKFSRASEMAVALCPEVQKVIGGAEPQRRSR